MKFGAIISAFLLLVFGTATALASTNPVAQSNKQLAPDCHLSGKGEIFILDQNTKTYHVDDQNSYSLLATRSPVGNGMYLFKETKTFTDGRPNEVTMFLLTMSTGAAHYTAPDGSINSTTMCTRPGHCAGILTIKADSFTGHFITDFDSNGIRTVTFADDGSFVDEVLRTPTPCPFQSPK